MSAIFVFTVKKFKGAYPESSDYYAATLGDWSKGGCPPDNDICHGATPSEAINEWLVHYGDIFNGEGWVYDE